MLSNLHAARAARRLVPAQRSKTILNDTRRLTIRLTACPPAQPHAQTAQTAQTAQASYVQQIRNQATIKAIEKAAQAPVGRTATRTARLAASETPNRPAMRYGGGYAPADSDLDHLEVFLARAALGASPVNGNILPARAGRDAFVWQTGFFVVNPAADQAHPASIFHSYAASKSPKNRPHVHAANGRENCQENKSHDGTVLPFLCLATVTALESCAWRPVKTRKSLARGRSSVPRKRREAA